MLDLKRLFEKYRISWKDHGPNVGKNHINVSCPFCGNDPSYHLAINLTSFKYYCYRNPRHASNSVFFLLKKLGIPPREYSGLKIKIDTSSPIVADTRDYSEFQYFTPAEESREALDYLHSRHFENPVAISKQFDLRVSKQGKWAGRLIIPLTTGWTGRAMRAHIEPRYDAWTNEGGFFCYKHGSDSVIIVEGALDAMRIASVSQQFDVVAKCRMAMSSNLLTFIREYLSIFNGPDGTVPYYQHYQELVMLRSLCTNSTVEWLQLPKGVKDFCEMIESQARSALMI